MARLFYLDGLYEFSLRELLELRRQQSAPVASLEKADSIFRAALDGVFYCVSTVYSTVGEGSKPRTNTTQLKTEQGSAKEPSEATVAELDIDIDFLEAASELRGKIATRLLELSRV